ncbi:MAG: hypothetical protein DRJ64_00820 [Thermoprotei archaeon]|nr:MAG: hypothetical protein DRJ64_00820 [Thermoprotei archaeon]
MNRFSFTIWLILMNIRERIYSALNGNEVDYVPWAVKPNHLPRGEWERNLRNLGLGLTIPVRVYNLLRPHVRIEQIYENSFQTNIYKTPVGELIQKTRIDLPSEAGERSSHWTTVPLFKKEEDYKVLEFIIRDTIAKPSFEDAEIIETELGGDGVVYTNMGYSPLMELMINFMGFRGVAHEAIRRKDVFEEILEVIHEKKLEICKVVASSPIKIVLVGDNIDEMIVNPRFFEKYCIPYYEEYIDILKSAGKIVGSHMDGRLRSLGKLIGETRFDFIHGFTPPPSGNLPISEARKIWKDKTLWINIPEVIFYYESSQIVSYVKKLLKEAAPGDRLILSITETIPPRHRRKGYEAITRAVLEYGKYPINSS